MWVNSLVGGTRAAVNSLMARSGNYTTIFIPADFCGVKKDHRSYFINDFLSSRPSIEKTLVLVGDRRDADFVGQRLKNSMGNGAVVANHGGRTLEDRIAAYEIFDAAVANILVLVSPELVFIGEFFSTFIKLNNFYTCSLLFFFNRHSSH